MFQRINIRDQYVAYAAQQMRILTLPRAAGAGGVLSNILTPWGAICLVGGFMRCHRKSAVMKNSPHGILTGNLQSLNYDFVTTRLV